ncbi:MAG: BatA domain-containing protein [Melioribacteraceae bacterium]|nr:BatA domain-containing protein [Melioribacteraceae bacterium]
MIFLNPTVLLGLLAAGIPILIHLLNLRKLKKIEFSTLAFLKELQKTKIRKIKLKQWILLALRVLIIIFLVLSFARPTLESVDISAAASKAKTSSVFILDDSYSMSLINDNGSNFNKSKEIISTLLNDLQEGDDALIIQTTIPFEKNELTSNLTLLETELNLVEISKGKNHLPESINEALKYLSQSQNLNKEIYLFTDLQQNNIDNDFQFEINNVSDARIYIFNFVNNDKGNLGITEFSLNNQLIEKDKPISFSSVIANSSQKNVESIASLFINGKRSAQKSLSIQPGESELINFETTLTEDGLINAELTIEDDDIIEDNEAFLSLLVPEAVKVLLIYDNQSDAAFIESALQNDITKNKIELSKYSSDNVFSSLISESDVILYIGEKIKTAEILNSESRKNLILFPPSNSNQNSYNGFLSRINLPNRFNKIELRDNTIQFDEIDFEHPIFGGLFNEDEKPSVNSPSITKYYKSSSNLNGKRIISLIDKSPLIYESSNENITMINFNLSPVLSWSDFPLKSLFAPIIIRSIFYLSSSEALQQSINSLEEIAFEKNQFRSNIISVLKPNGKRDILSSDSLNSVNRYNYSSTDETGIYKVYDNNNLTTAFSVNHYNEESNLVWSNEERFTNFINDVSDNIIFLNSNDNFKEKINQTRFGTELWRFFLILALMAAILEMIISRNTKKDLADLG